MKLRNDDSRYRFSMAPDASDGPGSAHEPGRADPRADLLREDFARAAGGARPAGFDAALKPLVPVYARFVPEPRPNWLEQIWDAIVEFLLAFIDPQTGTFDRPDLIREHAAEIWQNLAPDQRSALASLFASPDFARNPDFFTAQLASLLRLRPGYAASSVEALEDAACLLEGLQTAARRYPACPEKGHAPWFDARRAVVERSRADFTVDPRSALAYVVRRGETLSIIAADKNIPLDALVAANPQIENTWRIVPGQIITLPEPVEPGGLEGVGEGARVTLARARASLYVVRPGDTLPEVAAAHGTMPEALLALNRQITSTGRIYPGDVIRLRVPGPRDQESSMHPR